MFTLRVASVIALMAALLRPCAAAPILVLQDGHGANVESIASSADGRLLASGGMDGIVKIWDVPARRVLATLAAHKDAVMSLSFSRDGRLLASCGDGTVRIWETVGGSLLRDFHVRGQFAFSAAVLAPDGKRLFVSATEETGDKRSHVVEIDMAEGKPVGVLQGPADATYGPLAVASGGTALAAGYSTDTTAGVVVWDLPSRAPRTHFVWKDAAIVASVALNPAGTRFAASTYDGVAVLGSVQGTERLAVSAKRLTFSPDGRLLATVQRGPVVRILDGTDGHEVAALEKSADAREPGGTAWSGPLLAITVHGESAGSSGIRRPDGRIQLWDVPSGKRVAALGGRETWVDSVAFSNGALLVTSLAGDDQKAGIPTLERRIDAWSLTTGVPTSVVRRINMDDLSPRDPRWSRVATPLVRQALANLPSVAFTADGMAAASGEWHSGAFLARGGRAVQLAPRGGAVAFTRDGQLLAAAMPGDVGLFDVASGRLQGLLRTERQKGVVKEDETTVSALAFTADARRLVGGDMDGRIHFWDVAQRRASAPPGDAAVGGVSCVSISPDSKVAASGGWDGSIRLWTIATGQLQRRLEGHASRVTALAFSRDGRVLVSGSEDTSVRVWRAGDGALLATMVGLDGGRNWIVVSPEGFFDGSPRGMQGVLFRLGGLADTAEPEQFFNEFYHPGLLADVIHEGRPIHEILAERGDPRASMTIERKDRRLPGVAIDVAGQATTRLVPVQVRVAEVPPGSGSGIRDVRLFRNGTLVRHWAGEQKAGVLEATIPVVAGENILTAYAFNREGVKSKDATAAVTGASSLLRAPQAWVLAIGINRYQIPALNLQYAVADANETAARLRSSLPFSPSAIHVTTLLDEKATRAGILAALEQIGREAQPEDTVIVTHSSHGVVYKGHLYLVPHDLGTTLVDEDVARHSVSDEDLERAFLPLQAGHIALILDACHSGQALMSDEWRQGPMNARGLVQLAWEKGMEVLTASQSQQAAQEAWQIDGRRIAHGLLTYALMEGLDKAPRTASRLLVRDWFDYAAARVPRLVTSGALRGRDLVLEKLTVKPIQVPRVFHRREDGGEWPVAR